MIKQEMARMNTDILGISELKWTGTGPFSSFDHCNYYYYCGKSPLKNCSSPHSQQQSLKCSIWVQSQKRQNDLCSFQVKPFNITIIQVYAPTSNAEEAEWFYEDLQDLLELTPQKDVLFITGDWNAKVGSQGTPGVTGKFGLGIRNEARQRLIEFCQENALVIT